MLTILQTIGVAAAYLAVTLVLPWVLLRGRLKSFRLPARFMTYFMIGNFYCMNLVYLLQLLHISSRLTLILGTLAPFIGVAAVQWKKSFGARLGRCLERLRMVSEGQLGRRTLLLRLGKRIGRLSSGWLGKWLAPRWLEALLAAGTVALILYIYGTNTVNVYGYCSSDMVLHNYWINHMENNNIFVDGVYPFGFHCVIYYLHEVFAIPTYVLLRVFALAQTLMIHLMLLSFLRLLCKAKYTPYIGVMAYVMSGVFYQYTYYRYYAALPQEYGMIFILPAAWFAIAFLREKDFIPVVKKEVSEEQKEGQKRQGLVFRGLFRRKLRATREARWNLALFAIAISMTLTVHFYDTIAAGLLCLGIGVGFAFRCLRWRYLKRLMLAGVTGILIAVLPMGAAYAMGRPLQGSLYWGMNMLSSGGGDSGAEEESASGTDGKKEGGGTESGEKKAPPKEALSRKLERGLVCVLGELKYYVTNDSMDVVWFMLGSVAAVLALGVLWLILRRPDYGGALISVGVYMGVLCVLQASSKLGLPQLIEVSRYSVYIGYGLPIVWGLCLDAALYLLFREKRAINLGAVAALAAACVAVAVTGVRRPACLSAYESNEAILCLTNILRENRGNTSWTICSANDEQQMTWGKGYHYELIEFLRGQESVKEQPVITIPTDTVYFFVEKVPLLYLDYLNTIRPDKEVSRKGAGTPLPKVKGILPYIREERWVTMSHIYYWAQAFREMYPNEMEVYYETDAFVCYRVRQDAYNLYNFAIDYGYNE